MNLLINSAEETKGNSGLLRPLLEMWEEAKAQNKARADQRAKGMDDSEEIERPLKKEERKSLMDNFEGKWGYVLSQDELMWAHLLGRMKRKRDRSGEALIELDRVGTATEGGTSPGAKTMHHADTGITTSYKSWAGTTREIPGNYLMMKLFEALGVTSSSSSSFHLLSFLFSSYSFCVSYS